MDTALVLVVTLLAFLVLAGVVVGLVSDARDDVYPCLEVAEGVSDTCR